MYFRFDFSTQNQYLTAVIGFDARPYFLVRDVRKLVLMRNRHQTPTKIEQILFESCGTLIRARDVLPRVPGMEFKYRTFPVLPVNVLLRVLLEIGDAELDQWFRAAWIAGGVKPVNLNNFRIAVEYPHLTAENAKMPKFVVDPLCTTKFQSDYWPHMCRATMILYDQLPKIAMQQQPKRNPQQPPPPTHTDAIVDEGTSSQHFVLPMCDDTTSQDASQPYSPQQLPSSETNTSLNLVNHTNHDTEQQQPNHQKPLLVVSAVKPESMDEDQEPIHSIDSNILSELEFLDEETQPEPMDQQESIALNSGNNGSNETSLANTVKETVDSRPDRVVLRWGLENGKTQSIYLKDYPKWVEFKGDDGNIIFISNANMKNG